MFYKRLEEICKEKYITTYELGSKLGIPHTDISSWENGKTEPTYETAEKIAAELDCDIEYLLCVKRNDKILNKKISKFLSDSNSDFQTVAEKFGISLETLLSWNSGLSTSCYDYLKRISEVFNKSIDDLLGRDKAFDSEEYEFNAYLQKLRTRPEVNMLLKKTVKATKEEIEDATKYIEDLIGKRNDD